MSKIAFMFPGQGSQTIGMGKDLYEQYPSIQNMYKEANEILGIDLQEIMFNGPKEKLTKTENAQPALLLASMSLFSLLKKEGIQPDMTVGHSLGEYSALVASGALSLSEALTLVHKRGKLMEEAYPAGKGAMAAVLGMTEDAIQNVLIEAKDHVVDIANLNCPGQVVISGTKEGVQYVSEHLKQNGAKRVLPLNVSGPFHSRLMEKASKSFAPHLQKVSIKEAKPPVYANVTAKPVMNPEDIKSLLIKQLYAPVRFEESVKSMIAAGADTFIEIGNGKVLRGLVRKIDRNVVTHSITDVASLQAWMNWYKEEYSC